MRIAIVIIAGLVIAAAIWIGVSGNEHARVVGAVIFTPGAEAEFDPPSGVCSMDPRFRPRPGQHSCRAGP